MNQESETAASVHGKLQQELTEENARSNASKQELQSEVASERSIAAAKTKNLESDLNKIHSDLQKEQQINKGHQEQLVMKGEEDAAAIRVQRVHRGNAARSETKAFKDQKDQAEMQQSELAACEEELKQQSEAREKLQTEFATLQTKAKAALQSKEKQYEKLQAAYTQECQAAQSLQGDSLSLLEAHKALQDQEGKSGTIEANTEKLHQECHSQAGELVSLKSELAQLQDLFTQEHTAAQKYRKRLQKYDQSIAQQQGQRDSPGTQTPQQVGKETSQTPDQQSHRSSERRESRNERRSVSGTSNKEGRSERRSHGGTQETRHDRSQSREQRQ